jgi:DNA-binding IclR family transcriptional regulator
MAQDAAAELEHLLGAPLPAAVARLPKADLARLTEQITAARRRQAKVVDDAVRTAVTGVPLPVRGIVRKALLG